RVCTRPFQARPVVPSGSTTGGGSSSVELDLRAPEDRRIAERFAVHHALRGQRLGRAGLDGEHVRLRRTAVASADRAREHAEEARRLAAGGTEDDSRKAVLVVLEVALAAPAGGVAGGSHAAGGTAAAGVVAARSHRIAK